MWKNSWLLGVIVLIFLSVSCSGPSVTNSSTRNSPEQSASPIERDIKQQKPEETLVAGTVLRASFQHDLSTDINAPGDSFTMRVVDDCKVNGRVVIPTGSSIKGIVSDSVRSGRVKGRAHLALKFTEVVLPNGRSYPIEVPSVSRLAPATKKRDAMIIGGGAGIGSLVGSIAGGGKGAAIGAAAGMGAGTGAVLATRGKETGFGAGSTLSLRLNQPVRVEL